MMKGVLLTASNTKGKSAGKQLVSYMERAGLAADGEHVDGGQGFGEEEEEGIDIHSLEIKKKKEKEQEKEQQKEKEQITKTPKSLKQLNQQNKPRNVEYYSKPIGQTLLLRELLIALDQRNINQREIDQEEVKEKEKEKETNKIRMEEKNKEDTNLNENKIQHSQQV
ncbi:MAG: hypothetical protein EZS28_020593 [Streblomastix strix]|uniref:Uncharacterized protein n=1 Tax=Streblomastix strix TaxID=222440 RepID=A0A5J4VMY2_9EUKA|nr:MAG: hypothetical protein EZS28_020593 [Streblomastix strix]